MQSWPAPDVMYVCGITPYDATHLGHAATYLAFDLVNRLWRDAGHACTTCRTSPTSTTRCSSGPSATARTGSCLAMRETALFREDMTALRVLPPHDYVGAVESIPRIVELVEKMLLGTPAWPTSSTTAPDVYFTTSRHRPGLRLRVRLRRATMLRLFAERGGDPDRARQAHPLDPLLWRGERPGEPSWPSPFGRRPARLAHRVRGDRAGDRIGMGFDVQGGGSDLIFPHHEFSAVHAEASPGKPVRPAYVHAAMIGWTARR
jgi:L-cysteine:1D-myo-inositol 2-amino-2-deoxy-alpha-D-glucopyranoside ligase